MASDFGFELPSTPDVHTRPPPLSRRALWPRRKPRPSRCPAAPPPPAMGRCRRRKVRERKSETKRGRTRAVAEGEGTVCPNTLGPSPGTRAERTDQRRKTAHARQPEHEGRLASLHRERGVVQSHACYESATPHLEPPSQRPRSASLPPPTILGGAAPAQGRRAAVPRERLRVRATAMEETCLHAPCRPPHQQMRWPSKSGRRRP